MYRVRQIQKYSDERLHEIYAEPHCHTLWEDHIHRVAETIKLGYRLGMTGRVTDLSCGDATIARALSDTPVLGDFAPGYEFQGPIEQTISQIPFSDVFVLSETLEHLDDPDLVLRMIRNKSRKLLVTTPVHLDGQLDENPQHYFCWDLGAVCDMLVASGWSILGCEIIYNGIGYRYAAFGCQ